MTDDDHSRPLDLGSAGPSPGGPDRGSGSRRGTSSGSGTGSLARRVIARVSQVALWVYAVDRTIAGHGPLRWLAAAVVVLGLVDMVFTGVRWVRARRGAR